LFLGKFYAKSRAVKDFEICLAYCEDGKTRKEILIEIYREIS
jgi:hypothetical protein